MDSEDFVLVDDQRLYQRRRFEYVAEGVNEHACDADFEELETLESRKSEKIEGE